MAEAPSIRSVTIDKRRNQLLIYAAPQNGRNFIPNYSESFQSMYMAQARRTKTVPAAARRFALWLLRRVLQRVRLLSLAGRRSRISLPLQRSREPAMRFR